MKKITILKALAAFAAIYVLAGCQRMPLYNWSGNVTVKCTYHPEEILYNETAAPERIDVGFYDINSGKRVTWGMLLQNIAPDGTIDYRSSFNVRPGTYNIIAYSTITADNKTFWTTKATYLDNYDLVTAETSYSGELSGYKIVDNPIHFYSASLHDYTIPVTSEGEEYQISIDLYPITESYKMIIENVEGLENYRSGTFYLSNNYKENLLANCTPDGAAVLMFPGQGKKDVQADSTIAVTFNTFGIRNEGTVKASVNLLADDGRTHTLNVDITDQVRPENTEHIIRIDFPTKLYPLTQGGLEPTSDEWDENIEHYEIQ